ncbi:MAG TPA: hypothetical protein VNM91_12270 [Dehalococcoidia bacterium]|nr:hypothetical protein [Dehalococcoidia bacterium]
MSSRPEAEPSVRPAPLPLRRRGAGERTLPPDDVSAHSTRQSITEAVAQVLLAAAAFLVGALAALTLGAWLFSIVLAVIVAAACASWCGWRWIRDHRRGVQDAGERLHAVQRELDRLHPAAGGRR